jgi:putative nucleotidyltransferase with HDIG domain
MKIVIISNETEGTIRTILVCMGGNRFDLYEHSRRVAKHSLAIADELGLPDEEKTQIGISALLHDIGKAKVRDGILGKPTKLSKLEFEEVKRHPALGLQIVNRIAGLDQTSDGIQSHHERFDGRGYPVGLMGEEIPFSGRVIAVADAFDAMTSTRPYRKRMTTDRALEEIKRGAGIQFDPNIAESFLRVYKRRNGYYKTSRVLMEGIRLSDKFKLRLIP